ncbi:MAG: glycosyltransferase [Bdellovibrionota bacterium]
MTSAALHNTTERASSIRPKIQIVVPIYNEGENVCRLYRDLVAEGIEFDTLRFVYDFDGDTTLPYIAKMHADDTRVTADKNCFGRGVLQALRWGFAHAEPGPVLVVMGDNSDKLSIIPDMIARWRDGATVVAPSRYMKGGKQFGGGLVKSNMSRAAGVSLKLFGFPTADATNNFKLYDGEWLRSQKIESSGGFEVAMELCFHAYEQGKKIVELPTEWRDRTEGESRFKIFSWTPKYLRWYFKILNAMLRRRFGLSTAPSSASV